MIVCHCKAVNDRVIRKSVKEGARTRVEITEACEAGQVCGGCHPTIEEVLAEEQGIENPARREPLFTVSSS
jgi:bacterioferritin-associated ferredoxin